MAFGVLTGCAIGYYGVALLGGIAFLRRKCPAAAFTPAVTLLKPLKGADPGAYENLRSHCEQDYPEYQIVFGVAEAGDPAAAVVEQLRREFPERDIALVIAPEVFGANPKVNNLAQMLPAAKHDYLVINDGDIRVATDYLSRVVAPFSAEDVGLVTALYRGVPSATFASRLEAAGIATEFVPGVMAARLLEGGLHFALGSTLALRRYTLEEVGGISGLLDYLADDYELGRRVAERARVEAADTVVQTMLPPYSLGGAWCHELRWGRTQRACRPAGYAGRAVTFGLLWGTLAVILSAGAGWAWSLLAAAGALRITVAYFCADRILRDGGGFRYLWLIPVREVFGFCVWVGSLFGSTVTWRGKAYILRKGKLHPV